MGRTCAPKWLLHKQSDLSSGPWHPREKPGVAVCFCSPSMGKGRNQIPGVCWPSWIAEFQVQWKNLISKIKAEAQQDGRAGKSASLCKPNDLESISGTHIMVEGENWLHTAVFQLPHICICALLHHIQKHTTIINNNDDKIVSKRRHRTTEKNHSTLTSLTSGFYIHRHTRVCTSTHTCAHPYMHGYNISMHKEREEKKLMNSLWK